MESVVLFCTLFGAVFFLSIGSEAGIFSSVSRSTYFLFEYGNFLKVYNDKESRNFVIYTIRINCYCYEFKELIKGVHANGCGEKEQNRVFVAKLFERKLDTETTGRLF
jgi:hypothetical protein